jgi:hypothetical protein
MALGELQRSKLSKAGKRQLEAMLRAAANPDAEKPENVIKTLEPERRRDIEATMSVLATHRKSITQRGMDALNDMSDDEWDSMVMEANGS